MERNSTDNRIWTWVSEDGKSMHAGMDLGPVGTKPGGGVGYKPGCGGNCMECYSLKDGKYARSDGDDPGEPGGERPGNKGLTYSQSTGELREDGRHIATGYSGYEEGKNNPKKAGVPDIGPIPLGKWMLAGMNERKGPCTIILKPIRTTHDRVDKTGRQPGTFLIHGERDGYQGRSSHGCIIIRERAIREWLWSRHEKDWLYVIP